jgi:hypothetical protein
MNYNTYRTTVLSQGMGPGMQRILSYSNGGSLFDQYQQSVMRKNALRNAKKAYNSQLVNQLSSQYDINRLPVPKAMTGKMLGAVAGNVSQQGIKGVPTIGSMTTAYGAASDYFSGNKSLGQAAGQAFLGEGSNAHLLGSMFGIDTTDWIGGNKNSNFAPSGNTAGNWSSYQTGGYAASNPYLSSLTSLYNNLQGVLPESTNINQPIDYQDFLYGDFAKQKFLDARQDSIKDLSPTYYLPKREPSLPPGSRTAADNGVIMKEDYDSYKADSKSKSSPKHYEKQMGGFMQGANQHIEPTAEIEGGEYVFNPKGINENNFKQLDGTGRKHISSFGYLAQGPKHNDDNSGGIKVSSKDAYIASKYLGVDGNKSGKNNPSVADTMLKYGGKALANGEKRSWDKYAINKWNPGAMKHHLNMMMKVRDLAEKNKHLVEAEKQLLDMQSNLKKLTKSKTY